MSMSGGWMRVVKTQAIILNITRKGKNIHSDTE